MKYRLAFLTSHPIQYQAPLFRKLARCSELDLTVYFCSRLGLKGERDPGFGVSVQWDVPLLEGYHYRFLKNVSLVSDPRKFLAFFNPALFLEISKNKYDAILIHGYGTASNWIAFAQAFREKVPVVFHGETFLSESRRPFFESVKRKVLSWLFSRMGAFLYIGTQSKEFYRSFGIPEEKLFFSPYSVDNDFFIRQRTLWKPKREKLRHEMGIADDETVILYASKLIPRKRPKDLLLAFERLAGKVRLIFVGDGESRRSLEAYTKAKKIRKVHFAGFKNQGELPRYYSISDIFVLPSDFEPWGLVINEAMCFGLPVVTTTSVAAAADLVKEGKNGYVYSKGDLQSLAGILNQLINTKALREEMGKQSLEKISSWNHEACVRGILSAVKFAVKWEQAFVQ